MATIKKEPVISWTLVAMLLNVLQVSTLVVAPWLHILILIVVHAVAALAARQKVVPQAKLPDPAPVV